jgi:NAD(P)H-dependent FMN reductase
MTLIAGIAGSLRQKSFNRGLLRAAAEVAPAGTSVDIVSIDDIPLYNADGEEAEGIPAAVDRMKEAIASADGLLLVTPEYNNGIPGVFKNAIDWASRPASDIPRIFYGRPVAVIGASPGGFGTILAQNGWLPVLRTLRTRPWLEGRLLVSRAGSAFDEEGNLVHEEVRAQLRDFITGFAASISGKG